MDSLLTKPILTHSPAETEAVAVKLGANLRGGETIELVSDLGGGKTTFVRGLARGFGSTGIVASPTFTISRQYKAGDKIMYHFDFYRLNDAGVVAAELAEVVDDPRAVIVIEWGDIVKNVLPAERLSITFESTGDELRKLTFAYPPSLTYLISKVA